jgi:hypothetical protein
MIGMGEFVCRASQIPNDFLDELVTALTGILQRKLSTVAAAHGEPNTFEFRFYRRPFTQEIRFELVGFPGFAARDPARGDPVLALGPNGDAVCRAFWFGLRELQLRISAEAYQAEMEFPFPTPGLDELSELLGGEIASGPTGSLGDMVSAVAAGGRQLGQPG